MAKGTFIAAFVLVLALVYADDLSPPPYDRYNYYDIADPYNFIFAIDGGLQKQLNDVDDWAAGNAGEGVLDCYSNGIFDDNTCQIPNTFFHNPCALNAQLLCDAMGDGGTDDVFVPGSFEKQDPFMWGRMTGAVPLPYDVTRAFVYNKQYDKIDFLVWGIEYLPHKVPRTFVFEFNKKIINFTNVNDTLITLDPFRERGDLLIFTHFVPHHGFNVEVYILQEHGRFYTKRDLVFSKFFEAHQGVCREPTFFAGIFNDKLVPAAPWGGILSSVLAKDVNEPFTFFEAKIDLKPLKEKAGCDIFTNWVSVRSLHDCKSELENCKLFDSLGPQHYKLGHFYDHHDRPNKFYDGYW